MGLGWAPAARRIWTPERVFLKADYPTRCPATEVSATKTSARRSELHRATAFGRKFQFRECQETALPCHWRAYQRRTAIHPQATLDAARTLTPKCANSRRPDAKECLPKRRAEAKTDRPRLRPVAGRDQPRRRGDGDTAREKAAANHVPISPMPMPIAGPFCCYVR